MTQNFVDGTWGTQANEQTCYRVRYIGASSMWTWQFALMQNAAALNKWTKFISMQNHYSLLYREEEREMIPYCKATGVGLIPYSPLARGHLTRLPSSDIDTKRRTVESKIMPSATASLGSTDVDKLIIGRVHEIAEKKGWSMATVGLAWINGKVEAPIVGMSSVKRVEEALEAAGKRLEPEEVTYLEELYIPRAIVGHN